MTGAEIDLEQFEEIFGARVEDTSIKVARAVDRWFEHPKSAAELRLRNLIMQYRTARIAELDAGLVKQRERLAAAQAKMVAKPTKAAEKDLRIAPEQIKALEGRRSLLQHWEPTARDDRIFPMDYAPVVMMADGKPLIRLARYHCRQDGQPASVDTGKPGLYNARRDNIDRWWRKEFGKTHALMLVRTFYENVQRDGKNAVLHFIPKPAQLMLIACVYSVWQDPQGGRPLLSFAAVTDEPPEEVAAAGHDRMIINIQPQNVPLWLSPQGRTDAQLQSILSDRQKPYYEHEVIAAAAA